MQEKEKIHKLNKKLKRLEKNETKKKNRIKWNI